MPNFFGTSCGLPSLPEPDYDFVAGRCQPTPAPPAIFACTPLDILPDPPPPPCAIITATAIVDHTATLGELAADVAVTTGSQNCEYQFDFRFLLPPAICPTIGVGTTTTLTTGEPHVDVTVTPGATSVCEFQLDFAFTLPRAICPALTVGTTTTHTEGAPNVDITVTPGAGSLCELQLDFAFTLPEAICPVLSVGATTTLFGGDPNVDVVVTRGETSLCAFQFDFAFTLPTAICPAVTVVATTTREAGEPNVDVTVTRGDTSTCDFQFDFAFTLPPAICPTVTASGQVEIEYASSDTFSPTVDIVTTRTETSSACEIQLDFSFKLPKPPCPVLWGAGTVAISDTTDEPTVAVIISRITADPFGSLASPDDGFDTRNCNFLVDLDLTFPPGFGSGSGEAPMEGCLTTAVTASSDAVTSPVYFSFQPLVVGMSGGLVPGGSPIVGVNRSGLAGPIGSYVEVTKINGEWRLSLLLAGGCLSSFGSSASTGGNSGTTTPCGCCNCFDCLSLDKLSVGDCPACTDGAAVSYEFDIGTYSAFPALSGNKTVTHTTGCTWLSANITVTTPIWVTATYYIVGDYVVHGSNQYVCTGAGTSGSTGPTGTGTGIVDGGALWNFSP